MDLNLNGKSQLSQPIHPRKRFTAESVVLFVGSLLLITLAIVQGWFSRLDNAVYDLYINRHAAPMDGQVVIVAIDDASLHAYGPWPWPRDLQARLLHQINQHRPATVALDVVYSGTSDHDAALVEAAAATSYLALPMMIDNVNFRGLPVEVMPFPDLLEQVDRIGHVQFELDDDAIARGTYLFQGVGSARWPHLMQALSGSEGARCENTVRGLQLHQCDYVRVPFAGPSSTYPQISAVQLLQPDRGANLQQILNNKTVLVGLTGLGVGDWVPTPNSAQNGPIPGVEFNANLYAAIKQDTLIRPAALAVSLTLALLVAGLCTYLLPRLAAKPMLATTFILASLPLIANVVSIHLLQQYLSVAAASVGVLLIYPVWSWRRHEIAWAFIQQELERIDAESTAWQEHSHLGPTSRGSLTANVAQILRGQIQENAEGALTLQRDAQPTSVEAALLNQLQQTLTSPDQIQPAIPAERLAGQIERLESRARQMREDRGVSLEGLGRMANGVVIFSALGSIRFSNDAAEELLQPRADQTCFELLEVLTPPLGSTWPDMVRRILFEGVSFSFETLVQQTPLFVAAEPLSAPTDSDSDYAQHWVLTMADLSAIRQAQAQREEALAFLSHDIRSPLLSVLALIRNAGEPSELLKQITQYTQKGLATSDQFLQLSRLQLQQTFETYDVAVDQLIANAVDQVYFLAKEKNIAIRQIEAFDNQVGDTTEDTTEDGVWISGNGELLERAFVNLLGNAIKYSDEHSEIRVTLKVGEDTVQIAVADHGHGIPADELDLIFDPYFRSGQQVLAENRGAGLGLRFVKTVIERHAGEVNVTSTWGEGSTFTVLLPRPVDLPPG